jgi:hypothetical protein
LCFARGELTFRQVNAADANAPAPNEVRSVFLISLLAAAHVFLFAAAFPFFNSTDEQLHFDLAVRYSQADIPRGLEPVSPEAIRYIVMFSSHAFLADPASLPDGKLPPPPWTRPPQTYLAELGASAVQWRNIVNTEGATPPLYYAAAGAWWKLGKLLGFQGECLLYWLRFLNLVVVCAVIWLGWFTARIVFPENLFVRLAVPALIAFMPQTAFYSINNDILTPLTFGAAFFLLLKFREAPVPAPGLAAAAGLALAANFLTKISTLPLLAASTLFLAAKTVQLGRGKNLKPAIPSLLALLAFALLPALAWMFWCKTISGDVTGTAAKISNLGWTARPLTEWLSHPIFSLRGLWIFSGDTLATFWQGEFLWFRQPLAIPAMDLFYKIFTLIALALALAALRKRPPASRAAMGFAFASLAATFAFFALLSVKYDFQDCYYPSRAHPFFTSGRLYLGLLIPVMMLIASGLDFALQKLSLRTRFVVLAALLLFMLAGETAVDWRVFPCEYNWYHL